MGSLLYSAKLQIFHCKIFRHFFHQAAVSKVYNLIMVNTVEVGNPFHYHANVMVLSNGLLKMRVERLEEDGFYLENFCKSCTYSYVLELNFLKRMIKTENLSSLKVFSDSLGRISIFLRSRRYQSVHYTVLWKWLREVKTVRIDSLHWLLIGWKKCSFESVEIK